MITRESVLALMLRLLQEGPNCSAELSTCELEGLDFLHALTDLDDPRPDLKALTKLWRSCAAKSRGELVGQCLLAYEEALPDASAGLIAVYEWMRFRAPKIYPPVILGGGEIKAKRAASELYGDCYLVMAEFVAAWNMKARPS